MNIHRRHLIVGLGSVTALGFASLIGLPAGFGRMEAAAQTDIEELMLSGPLGERALGDPDAPVTMVEYASMTCGHCATFHNQTYPELKTRYIDEGQVRYVFREFPLDPLATAAFMLARCAAGDAERLAAGETMEGDDFEAGNERYFALIDVLFEQQRSWAYADDPVSGLFDVVRQAGFTQESFESCLTNQELLDAVNWVKNRGAERFDVRSTPTFFVNGEIVRGALSLEEFEEIFQPHLRS